VAALPPIVVEDRQLVVLSQQAGHCVGNRGIGMAATETEAAADSSRNRGSICSRRSRGPKPRCSK
jgi:hypothetical protein